MPHDNQGGVSFFRDPVHDSTPTWLYACEACNFSRKKASDDTALGFSDDVQVRLPISDMRKVSELPHLVIRGLTNYGAVFDDLVRRIPEDVQELKREGYKVHRPVVFLLTDGQPSDGGEWRSPLALLTDRTRTPAAPTIISCGIGEAQPMTMVEVATRPEFAFIARQEVDVSQAISEFFHALTSSMVASGVAVNSGVPQLVVNRPEQFIAAIDAI